VIALTEVTMENLSAVTALAAGPEDGQFVPSAAEIAARAWVLRSHGAALHAIEAEGRTVGLALVYELDELPACYCLMEMLIDHRHRRRGYASEALREIIARCGAARKYPAIELAVDRQNIAAIACYTKAGFVDSGYVDPALPQYVNMIYRFEGSSERSSIAAPDLT